jgi:hypothetical protein
MTRRANDNRARLIGLLLIGVFVVQASLSFRFGPLLAIFAPAIVLGAGAALIATEPQTAPPSALRWLICGVLATMALLLCTLAEGADRPLRVYMISAVFGDVAAFLAARMLTFRRTNRMA